MNVVINQANKISVHIARECVINSLSDFSQANLVIVPKEYALDFAIFCQRNPKPCPLLGITDPGGCSVPIIAEKDDFNIYTDCPK